MKSKKLKSKKNSFWFECEGVGGNWYSNRKTLRKLLFEKKTEFLLNQNSWKNSHKLNHCNLIQFNQITSMCWCRFLIKSFSRHSPTTLTVLDTRNQEYFYWKIINEISFVDSFHIIVIFVCCYSISSTSSTFSFSLLLFLPFERYARWLPK